MISITLQPLQLPPSLLSSIAATLFGNTGTTFADVGQQSKGLMPFAPFFLLSAPKQWHPVIFADCRGASSTILAISPHADSFNRTIIHGKILIYSILRLW